MDGVRKERTRVRERTRDGLDGREERERARACDNDNNNNNNNNGHGLLGTSSSER